MTFPTPHGHQLKALRENDKLPDSDKDGLEVAIKKYEEWILESKEIVKGGEELVQRLVEALNCYKNWIDLDFVFDSPNEFLYRDKSQLKLDNTILEEFLPILVNGPLSRLRNVSRIAPRSDESFSTSVFQFESTEY